MVAHDLMNAAPILSVGIGVRIYRVEPLLPSSSIAGIIQLSDTLFVYLIANIINIITANNLWKK